MVYLLLLVVILTPLIAAVPLLLGINLLNLSTVESRASVDIYCAIVAPSISQRIEYTGSDIALQLNIPFSPCNLLESTGLSVNTGPAGGVKERDSDP